MNKPLTQTINIIQNALESLDSARRQLEEYQNYEKWRKEFVERNGREVDRFSEEHLADFNETGVDPFDLDGKIDKDKFYELEFHFQHEKTSSEEYEEIIKLLEKSYEGLANKKWEIIEKSK